MVKTENPGGESIESILLSLGIKKKYKIEKPEASDDLNIDSPYKEIIRVKASHPLKPVFATPSHLYKYSYFQFGLYLKDHNNLWIKLGKLLNQEVDDSDQEVIFIFPYAKFEDVSKIVPFLKNGRTEEVKLESNKKEVKLKSTQKHTHKTMQNTSKTSIKTLDDIFDMGSDKK